MTVSHAGWLEWTNGALAGCQEVGTPTNKKEPSVPSLNRVFLPRSSKRAFLIVTTAHLYLTYVINSGVLEQPAEDKPASMSFCVLWRAIVVLWKKVWQTAAGKLRISKIQRLIAKTKRLREPLDALDAHCLHLRIQLCFLQDMLDHMELEFSALSSEYYCMT